MVMFYHLKSMKGAYGDRNITSQHLSTSLKLRNLFPISSSKVKKNWIEKMEKEKVDDKKKLRSLMTLFHLWNMSIRISKVLWQLVRKSSWWDDFNLSFSSLTPDRVESLSFLISYFSKEEPSSESTRAPFSHILSLIQLEHVQAKY